MFKKGDVITKITNHAVEGKDRTIYLLNGKYAASYPYFDDIVNWVLIVPLNNWLGLEISIHEVE